MKKPVLVGILFLVVIFGIILYSTLTLAKYKVEVCMSFGGQVSCRTAAGDSEEHAIRTATSNACAQIASGMTDSMACERATPTSLRWVKR